MRQIFILGIVFFASLPFSSFAHDCFKQLVDGERTFSFGVFPEESQFGTFFSNDQEHFRREGYAVVDLTHFFDSDIATKLNSALPPITEGIVESIGDFFAYDPRYVFRPSRRSPVVTQLPHMNTSLIHLIRWIGTLITYVIEEDFIPSFSSSAIRIQSATQDMSRLSWNWHVDGSDVTALLSFEGDGPDILGSAALEPVREFDVYSRTNSCFELNSSWANFFAGVKPRSIPKLHLVIFRGYTQTMRSEPKSYLVHRTPIIPQKRKLLVIR